MSFHQQTMPTRRPPRRIFLQNSRILTSVNSTGDLNINNRMSLSLFSDDVKINDSQFFEVMYVGKIRVSHRKLPKSFIDDAIPKFIAHDKMKIKVRKSRNCD